jgi:hypothetical protein
MLFLMNKVKTNVPLLRLKVFNNLFNAIKQKVSIIEDLHLTLYGGRRHKKDERCVRSSSFFRFREYKIEKLNGALIAFVVNESILE